MHTISEKRLLMLKPCEILPNLERARKDFDSYDIRILAKSISLYGIIEPLTVRKCENGRYELISGERRLKAAILAGIRRVPCIVHSIDRKTAMIYSAIENIQRKDLNFFEQAKAIERLIEEYSLLKSEISVNLAISEKQLEDKLSLLRYDNESMKRILLFSLSEEQALEILKLPIIYRNEALDAVISEEMSLKETKEYVKRVLSPNDKKESSEEKPKEIPKEILPHRKYIIGDMRLFYNSLSKLLQTLTNSGIETTLKKSESDKYIEYRIRILKSQNEKNTAEQLKIC